MLEPDSAPQGVKVVCKGVDCVGGRGVILLLRASASHTSAVARWWCADRRGASPSHSSPSTPPSALVLSPLADPTSAAPSPELSPASKPRSDPGPEPDCSCSDVCGSSCCCCCSCCVWGPTSVARRQAAAASAMPSHWTCDCLPHGCQCPPFTCRCAAGNRTDRACSCCPSFPCWPGDRC